MATATQANYQSTILAYCYHSIVISFLFLGYPYHIRAHDFWAVTGSNWALRFLSEISFEFRSKKIRYFLIFFARKTIEITGEIDSEKDNRLQFLFQLKLLRNFK